jgi:hypothetical protein
VSREFDGVDDRLDNTTSIPLSAYPFSMACWFRSDSITVNQTLMQLQDKDSTSPRQYLRCAGAVASDPVQAVTATSGSTQTASTSTSYTAATWHHACGVWASDTSRAAYLNGGGKGTNATSRTFNSGAGMDSVTIGCAGHSTPDNFTDGRIAYAAIWNVALSDAEVALLAGGDHPLAVQGAAVVAYWRLTGTDSPELDTEGSLPWNLTLTGTTAGADDPTVDPPPGGAATSFPPIRRRPLRGLYAR